MKEQFVTYEIALKLKELGFGMDDYLQLPFYYDKEGNLHLMEVCISKKYNPSFSHLGANSIDDFDAKLGWVDNSLDEIYLAPLWQQAIDWLNSKNLYIFFYRGENSRYRNVFTFCILNTHYTLVDFDFENGNLDFYIIREQAILKAIELCQNKK